MKDISFNPIKGSIEERAGRIAIGHVVSIISSAKNKRQLPDGRFSLPNYEFYRLCGILLRLPKNKAKVLLSCLFDSGIVEQSPMHDAIVFGSEVDSYG